MTNETTSPNDEERGGSPYPPRKHVRHEMRYSIFAFILLVPLVGCNVSPARYVLKIHREVKGFDNREFPLQEREAISAELSRIRAYCQDLHDIKSNKGRCVVGKDGLSFQIIFDERDWTRNVRLNVHYADSIGVEAVGPKWIVLDTKMNLEHHWFYGSHCPVAEDRMWQVLKELYGL